MTICEQKDLELSAGYALIGAAMGQFPAQPVSLAHHNSQFTQDKQRILQETLASLGLINVWETIEKPLVPILSNMRNHGIRMDIRSLQSAKRVYQAAPNERMNNFSRTADSLLKAINPKTGRIHPHFEQIGTVNGHILSRKPCVHNIPASQQDPGNIRRAFTASPGCLFISADYKHIEMRLLAHYAQDKSLISLFQQKTDIYTIISAKLFRRPESAVTKAMREKTKRLIFTILNGIGCHDRDSGENKAWAQAFFRQFPALAGYLARIEREVQPEDVITTLGGRKRMLPEINNPKRLATLATHTRINGSSADLVKTALIAIDRELTEQHSPARPILTVYDEIFLEAPYGQSSRKAAEILQGAMINAGKALNCMVPLEVSCSIGPNRGSLRPYTVNARPQTSSA